jgi:hypothetical protein
MFASRLLKKILGEGSCPSLMGCFTGIFVELVCPNRRFLGVQAHFSLNLGGVNHRQVPHPHEIVGGRREGEDPSHFEDSAVPSLAQHAHRL